MQLILFYPNIRTCCTNSGAEIASYYFLRNLRAKWLNKKIVNFWNVFHGGTSIINIFGEIKTVNKILNPIPAGSLVPPGQKIIGPCPPPPLPAYFEKGGLSLNGVKDNGQANKINRSADIKQNNLIYPFVLYSHYAPFNFY